MIWAGHVECMRKTKNAYRILVGKRCLLKLLWRGWKIKFELILKEVGSELDSSGSG
jgi:hypothetical protein